MSSDDRMTVSSLISNARFELIPLKNLEAQIAAIPPSSRLSMTCSPAKGLGATLDLTARLTDLGHKVVPHLSARLVRDKQHTQELASWLADHGVDEIFVVGGDSPDPIGDYVDAVGFMRDLLNGDHSLTSVGFTAYPDGHTSIPSPILSVALAAKQTLLKDAGVLGHVSTQMCFDADKIQSWLAGERANGFVLPVHLGIPGVIDRTKLVTMGARLGIGSSLRFVKKNRSTLTRLLRPGGYNPSTLLKKIGPASARLGIEGLHVFTFNEVAATVEWHRSQM